MTYSLRYISNSKGKTQAVQVAIGDWKKIEQKLREAEFLTKLRKNIDSALDEVVLHTQGKKQLKTLEEVLAEM